MRLVSGAVAAAALFIFGCGVDIDLNGLTFLAEESADVAPGGKEDVEEEGIACAYYYHCLLERVATNGDPAECMDEVTPGEAARVGAVENCRKDACVKQEQIPGNAAFSPESFMECVMSKCWAEVAECGPGHGDKSCKDFADEYLAYAEGAEPCDEAAPELCILEALYPVTASQTDAIDLLLGCIFTEYRFGAEYETCVSKCNLSP